MTEPAPELPQLSEGYSRARTTAVTSAALIYWGAIFNQPFPDPLPFLGISPPARATAFTLLVIVLTYACIRLAIEWHQSDPRRRTHLASRIDLFVTAAIVVGALALWAYRLAGNPLPPGLPVVPAVTMVVMGMVGGIALSNLLWTAQFIRSKQAAAQTGLPRIPIATQAAFRLVLTYVLGLLLTAALSPGFVRPLWQLWLWLVLGPLLLLTLGSSLDVILPRLVLHGERREPHAANLRRLQAVFDAHDTSYLIGGWAEGSPTRASAIFKAAQVGHADSLLRLLRNGADPNEVGQVGWTPLLIAVAQQQIKAVEVLLEFGAEPNVSNALGRTPLMFACRYGNKDLVERLLAAGADPNLRGVPTEMPALGVAAKLGHLEIVRLLLKAGSDPKLGDHDGHLPIHVAEKAGHGEVAAMLRHAMRSPPA